MDLDCEARYDYEDFFAGLGDRLGADLESDPLAFQRAAATIRQPSTLTVVLLDEVDELLSFDARQTPPGKLFKAFRAASQEGACRFVFSGSRTLYRHLRDPQSPFFNFCESTLLKRLEKKSVAEIVSKPMRQLGSSFPRKNHWSCD